MKFEPKPFVVERKRRSRQKSAEPKSIWADTPGWDPRAFEPTDGSLQQETVDVASQHPSEPAPALMAARAERVLPDRSMRAPGPETKSVRRSAPGKSQTAPESADAVAETTAEIDELNVPQLEIVNVVPSTAAVADSEAAASGTALASGLHSKPQLSYRTRRLLATKGLPLGQRWKRLLPKAAR